MHPVVILVPAAALIFGPRLWVRQVLQQHNRKDEDFPLEAHELARRLLDQSGLTTVRVEITDMGDHYDPATKTVRLARDKYGRKTLTALTTAAHEVAHALQDAAAYPPFVWRQNLGRVAQIAGEVGALLLVTVPAVALLARTPVPRAVIGAAALAMFGTGMAAQLAALPTELDASFRRALPLLREAHLAPRQAQAARKILFACSLTYVASSFVSVVNIWPWLGRRTGLSSAPIPLLAPVCAGGSSGRRAPTSAARAAARPRRRRREEGLPEALIRRFAKPLIRSWLIHRGNR